jgi:hypothetical protein
MSPASTTSTPATRFPKRGRPTRKWLSLAEVATALAWTEDGLERLLNTVPRALPAAVKGANGWEIPERALRELLEAKSGPLPSFATVADVADALRLDRKTIYAWTSLRGPDGRALLPAREILGRKLIDAKDVLALPATWPSWAPGRRSFLFSEEVDS